MMKRGTKQQTIEKYENALNILHYRLQMNEKINLTKFMKEMKIGNNVSSVLLNKGIIKRVSRGCYQWNSIKPTKDMAVAVLNEANEIVYRALQKSRAKKKTVAQPKVKAFKETPQTSNNKRTVIKTVSKRVLWGLWSKEEKREVINA